MIVAGAQLDIAWEDPATNLARADAAAAAARAVGATLFVLDDPVGGVFGLVTRVEPPDDGFDLLRADIAHQAGEAAGG